MKIIFISTFILLSSLTIVYAQDNTYEVYALQFTGPSKISSDHIAVGGTSEDTVTGCNMFWLLKGINDRIVLVDVGFTDTVTYKSHQYIRPDKVLEKTGITPEQISDIIITHPHWDHIGGIDLFPNAKVWMQKADYEYFVGTAWQEGGFSDGFNKSDVEKIVSINLEGRLKLVKGDSLEIIPGIWVFIGSKHTFESQYILVNINKDPIIIASDNIWFYYNLNNMLPIPHYTFDPEAYVYQMKRMKTMVKDQRLIIPGHDAEIFQIFQTIAEGVVIIK